MAHLSGYSKYKVLTLTGGADGALTDHQLKITVSKEAAMQGDFDDLRFTQSDGITLVDAWAELIVTDTSATVWVEFPTTPANTIEQIYRMYYGNAGAANYWDGDATFILFDDFGDGNYNGWTVVSGVWSATSNYLNTSSGSNTNIYNPVAYSLSRAIDFKVKLGNTLDEYWGLSAGKGSGTVGPSLYASSTTGYGIEFVPENGGEIKLRKRDAGGWAVGDLIGSTWAKDTNWHLISLTLDSASVFNLYLDGINKGNVTDSTYTSFTRFAITTWGADQNSVSVDDIRIRKYAANPPTYEFGAEQSVPTENPYWYYNLLKRRN